MLLYRILLLLFLGVCGACTPLLTSYPEGVQNQLRAIKIETIPDRNGQYLRLRLLKMLDCEETTQASRYRLAIHLSKQDTIIGIGRNATTRRMRVTMNLTYKLSDTYAGTVLKQGALKTYGSYNYISDGFYTNTVASEAIQLQTLDTLSDLVFLELATYFSSPQEKRTACKKK